MLTGCAIACRSWSANILNGRLFKNRHIASRQCGLPRPDCRTVPSADHRVSTLLVDGFSFT